MSAARKLTPWFPGSVKPARVGLYETEEPTGERWFNLFDGYDWHYGNEACVMPRGRGVLPSRFLRRWRGLRAMED